MLGVREARFLDEPRAASATLPANFMSIWSVSSGKCGRSGW